MSAPRGFPTLLPLTNDSAAGEVILHKVTKYLDLGDITTTALRYFGSPVTLLFDPYANVAYILTDSGDRDAAIDFADGLPFIEVKPDSGQEGSVLTWYRNNQDSPPSELSDATNRIITPQQPRVSVGAFLNTVHLHANAFSIMDQVTGKVTFFVPSDLAAMSAAIESAGFSGSGKRVAVKLNAPTAAIF